MNVNIARPYGYPVGRQEQVEDVQGPVLAFYHPLTDPATHRSQVDAVVRGGLPEVRPAGSG